MKICVIDIGTNSVHTIYANLNSSGQFDIIGREKEMVQLGKGSMVTGMLQEESMAATIEALKKAQHIAQYRGISSIHAITTSAVRESKNGGEFLDRIKKEIGIKVKIITGLEEARLIHLAVKHTIDLQGQLATIIDIGGGSTEFIITNGTKPKWMVSKHLGSNRLAQLLPLSDPPERSEIKELEEHIKEELKGVCKRIKKNNIQTVVGTSGTLNNLARILLLQQTSKSDEPELRQAILSYEDIYGLYKELQTSTLHERKCMKGLDKKRAHMFIQGIAILKVLMKECDIPSFISCDTALREGVVWDIIENNQKDLEIESLIPDVRRRSVMGLLDKYPDLKKHSLHTAKLALQIFDQLKKVHGLGPSYREYLEYAALLHDIGYHINFKAHHKHTFYLITNSDLSGFMPKEIQMIAWVARSHRRRFNKKKMDDLDINADIKKDVLKLSAILRIADAFDRTHFSLVKDVKVTKREERITFNLVASSEVQWEIHEASERQDLFEKVFKTSISYKVTIEESER